MLAVLAVAVLAGCGQAETGSTDPTTSGIQRFPDVVQRFPDVVGVQVSADGEGYSFDVTISSPYDSPQRYADAFRVRSADGTVHGVRELAHDHAAEQPFTRSLTGVQLPPGIAEVVVEARDLRYGWGGETRTVPVPPRQ